MVPVGDAKELILTIRTVVTGEGLSQRLRPSCVARARAVHPRYVAQQCLWPERIQL